MRIGTFAFDHLVANPSIFEGVYSNFFPNYLENVLRNSIGVAAVKKDKALLDQVFDANKKVAELGGTLSTEDIYMNFYRMSGDAKNFLHQLFLKCDRQVAMTFNDTIQLKKMPTIANDLNESAWQMFLSISDKDTLQKALRWSKRAVELAPLSYSYLDTQACLLYKIGKRKQGIALEEKVLSMIPPSTTDYPNYEKVLKRMKAGEKIWEK